MTIPEETSPPSPAPHLSMTLPPPLELLYAICAPVVAEYIDELLAGRLKYDAHPPAGRRAGDGPAGDPEAYSDPAFSAPNAVLPLLQASVRVRHATLMVLSDALGIALDKSGVGRYACTSARCATVWI